MPVFRFGYRNPKNKEAPLLCKAIREEHWSKISISVEDAHIFDSEPNNTESTIPVLHEPNGIWYQSGLLVCIVLAVRLAVCRRDATHFGSMFTKHH